MSTNIIKYGTDRQFYRVRTNINYTTKRRNNSFFKNSVGKNWILTCKRMRVGSNLIPYPKIN